MKLYYTSVFDDQRAALSDGKPPALYTKARCSWRLAEGDYSPIRKIHDHVVFREVPLEVMEALHVRSSGALTTQVFSIEKMYKLLVWMCNMIHLRVFVSRFDRGQGCFLNLRCRSHRGL